MTPSCCRQAVKSGLKESVKSTNMNINQPKRWKIYLIILFTSSRFLRLSQGLGKFYLDNLISFQDVSRDRFESNKTLHRSHSQCHCTASLLVWWNSVVSSDLNLSLDVFKCIKCRLCSEKSDETQEHLQLCEGTRFERRGLDLSD